MNSSYFHYLFTILFVICKDISWDEIVKVLIGMKFVNIQSREQYFLGWERAMSKT